MKYITLIFMLLISCTQQKSEIVIKKDVEDSIKLEIVKRLLLDFQKFSRKSDSLNLITEENKKLRANYFSTLNYALNGKEYQIKSLYFQQKNDELNEQKKIVEKQMLDLSNKYEYSIRENEGYKYKLAEEYEKRSNILRDKAVLEQELSEASRLLITGFTINGIGTTTNLLGKTKEFNTDQASKIKKTKIVFSLPTNKFATKEEKRISVIIKSTDKKDDIKKDTIVNYVGTECKINLILENKKEFKEGTHIVNVIINNKLQPEEKFQVKK